MVALRKGFLPRLAWLRVFVVLGGCLLLVAMSAGGLNAATYTFSYTAKARPQSINLQGSLVTQTIDTDTWGNIKGMTLVEDFIDTDRDHMDDAWETAYGLNTSIDDSNGDPDDDGLSNYEEFLLGTDPTQDDTDHDGLKDGVEEGDGLIWTSPLSKDTDHDCLPDGWEFDNGLGLSANDTYSDPDGDGYPNILEYIYDTDPNDPTSYPTLIALPYLLLILE